MTKMLSDKVEINVSDETVFTFLCNFNNYQKLMPEQVVDWSSNDVEGMFTIKNMATIGLHIEEKLPNNLVKLIKTKAPFDLTLLCMINKLNDAQCILQLELQADLNPVLKMMAEKPLTNFINVLAHNCAKNFNTNN